VRSGERGQRSQPAEQQAPATASVPARVVATEREVIKAALQLPNVVGVQFDELGSNAFLGAVHQQLQVAMAAAGGAATGRPGPDWPALVAEQLPAESEARMAVNALAVEPLRVQPERAESYAMAMVASLANTVIEKEIGQLKATLQRAESNGDTDQVASLWPGLIELELKQREIKLRASGGES
ncbi:MAG: hypothetical protein ABI140_13835, partial [Jatrophihabitantaceae bacterium]